MLTRIQDSMPTLLLIGLLISLAGCSSGGDPEGVKSPDSSLSGRMALPTTEQLALDPEQLPQALLLMENQPVDAAAANKRSRSASLSSRASVSNNIIDSQSWEFDPFLANRDQNSTDANCGLPPAYEPGPGGTGSSIKKYGTSAFCIVAVAKQALMRGVTNYANFHNMLPDIAARLATDNNVKGVEDTFTNESVDTYGAKGLTIKVFYDDCSAQRNALLSDAGAFAYCTGQNDNAVYHRVRIYPLVGIRSGVTSSTVIGKMEWLMQPDASTDGTMIIADNLMSDVQPGFTPAQMQFDFQSDAAGGFRSFTMKFAQRLITGNSVSRELEWEANVVKVTRIPATATDPAVWTVQGSLQFELDLGINPLQGNGFGYHFHFGAGSHSNTVPRVYFSAVAEDIFTDGNAVYSAIMSDAWGLDRNAFAESQWPREFHLWAAYKKLLKTQYSQAHYENIHGLGGAKSVRLWNTSDARQSKLLALLGHSSAVTAISVNAANTRAVSASSDGSIKVWDIDPASSTYQQALTTFTDAHGLNGAVPYAVDNVSFNPVDDDLILSGGDDGTARVFRISTQTELLSVNQLNSSGFTLSANWSHDGTRIATASNQGSKIWDASTGGLIASLGDFGAGITNIVFDPTNSSWVLTGEWGGNARLWNVSAPATSNTDYTHPNTPFVNDAQFSPDGSQIGTVTKDGYFYLWNRADNSAPVKFSETRADSARRSATRLKFSADGSRVFVQVAPSLVAYDIATLAPKESYVGYSPSYPSSFTTIRSDSMLLVGIGSSGDINAYDPETGSREP
ncbi:MAG: hypothetical protein GXP10_08830, partial [Gammaproteobacteria bacterium]|nr:hypothetical protein [Gammaproteobacteria bacterium]